MPHVFDSLDSASSDCPHSPHSSSSSRPSRSLGPTRRAAPAPATALDPLAALSDTVFSIRQARAAGLRTSRARRADLVTAGPGLRRRRGSEPTPVEVAVAHARRDPSLVVSHASAAAHWGLWLPRRVEGQPHLSRARPGGAPRIRGAVGHRLRPSESSPLVDVGHGPSAYRITGPVRTWADLAALGLSVEELTIAGDALLRRPDAAADDLPAGWTHPLAGLEEMAAVVVGGGLQATPLLRAALAGVRARSDSAPESRLRLRMIAAGLPEPQVNPEVVLLRDARGRPVRTARPDLFYERARVAVQYEGTHHFADAEQYRRDMRRGQDYRDAGIEEVRVDKAVFTTGEWQRFVERIRVLLVTRGGA